MKINERFTWATELLNIQPSDHVLEIGCGTGILAAQIANQLVNGTITALDQSESMIRKAQDKNKAAIQTGKATFLVSAFNDASLANNQFDKIVAFNVNVFWKNPVKELALIKSYLKPTGKLYLFYQAPYEIDIQAAIPIEEVLTKNSFQILDTVLKKLHPVSALCITSTPTTTST